MEVEDTVWGGYGDRGVYVLDEVRSQWSRVADGEYGAILAVYGGHIRLGEVSSELV